MIVEYHRPNKLEAALALLARPEPPTYPLGGGTVLSQPGEAQYAVVDLQALGLNQIEAQGNGLTIGACTTLENLLSTAALPAALKNAICREASLNLRNMATVAGALVTADGRSPLAAAFLALDARLVYADGKETAYGDWLPLRERKGLLITHIRISIQPELKFEAVARTPVDKPILMVGSARWPSGRTRIVVGGWGTAPIVALDGSEAGGAVEAVRSAFSGADDQWAGALYRQNAAAALITRMLTAGAE